MRELKGFLTGTLMKDEDGFVYFSKSSSFKQPVYVYSNIVLDKYLGSIVTIQGDITYNEEGSPESIDYFYSPFDSSLPVVVVELENLNQITTEVVDYLESIKVPDDLGVCYICGVKFKPEDFSTYFTVDGQVTEALAHDDCLELLIHGLWKNFPVYELGHKVWGYE